MNPNNQRQQCTPTRKYLSRKQLIETMEMAWKILDGNKSGKPSFEKNIIKWGMIIMTENSSSSTSHRSLCTMNA